MVNNNIIKFSELFEIENSPKLESKSQKKRRVIAEGTKMENIVCPMCCQNRVLNKSDKGRVRFDQLDFNRYILQVRYTCGGGSGFYMNESESKTFDEIKNDPEYSDLIEQIKQTCFKILKRLED